MHAPAIIQFFKEIIFEANPQKFSAIRDALIPILVSVSTPFWRHQISIGKAIPDTNRYFL